QCANSSWAYWDSSIHTFPRLMEVTATGEFTKSPLLASDPVVQDNPFQVTYKLNPKAVWNDGTPITSADVAFTWHAKIDTKGSLSTVGYDQIAAVDTPDPQTAVVKFKQPFVDWADLFGGATDFVLKKAAFKSTDVSKDM